METTSPKMFCFVLMPFNSDFDDIYALGIKESCTNAEAYCERVDEQDYQGSMLERIFNQISKADVIIADMTTKNPNVFYEVGYAHALNKPTILLTQNAIDIPFDLKHFPHIVYEGKILKLKEELTKKIRWFANNSNSDIKKFKTEIDFYVNRKNLITNNVTYYYDGDPSFELVIHNVSPFTYQQGDFQVGILTDLNIAFRSIRNITQLPNGKYLHMLDNFNQMFPDAYSSKSIEFSRYGDEINNGFSLTIRLFSANGIVDYQLMLKDKNRFNIDEVEF